MQRDLHLVTSFLLFVVLFVYFLLNASALLKPKELSRPLLIIRVVITLAIGTLASYYLGTILNNQGRYLPGWLFGHRFAVIAWAGASAAGIIEQKARELKLSDLTRWR